MKKNPIRAYEFFNSGWWSGVNDGFGKAYACFEPGLLPGAIVFQEALNTASLKVLGLENCNSMSAYRIIRPVNIGEVKKLIRKATKKVRRFHPRGAWYEVIGE